MLKNTRLGLRDPIHKWIQFSPEEKQVIDTPLVQRLRWVSQLTGTDQVFPGGTNNRFSHSLGAMHLAGKYMKHLLREADEQIFPEEIKPKCIQIARLAALLHDIGHGPFSHAFDRTVYQVIYAASESSHIGGHDLHRLHLIKSSPLKEAIEGCGITSDDIARVWSSSPSSFDGRYNLDHVIKMVCQGLLGADRMDFTLRDSYFTGSEHLGTISPHRIISNSRIVQKDNVGNFTLGYNIKAFADISQALNDRMHMYECVYLHKTVTSVGILIEKMISAACEPLNLIARTLDADSFKFVTDHTLIGEIMNPNGPTELEEARKYCTRLMFRELPKLVEETLCSGQHIGQNSESEPQKELQPGQVLVRTRNISALNSAEFEKNEIVFLKKDEQLSCAQVLKLNHIDPRPPIYYLRIYQL